MRLVVINGHDAVVHNPGELNDSQGTQTDGTAGWKLHKAKRLSRAVLPLRASEWNFFASRAGDFSSYNETRRWRHSPRAHSMMIIYPLLARHDLKYRWPSFTGAVNNSVPSRLSLSGTGTATAIWNMNSRSKALQNFRLYVRHAGGTLSLYIPLSLFLSSKCAQIGVNEFGIDAIGLLAKTLSRFVE